MQVISLTQVRLDKTLQELQRVNSRLTRTLAHPRVREVLRRAALLRQHQQLARHQRRIRMHQLAGNSLPPAIHR